MNTIESIIEDGRQYWAINKSIRNVNFELIYKEIKCRTREDIAGLLEG